MASNNEVLIKLQADISNLQNGLKQAQTQIEGISGKAEASMSGLSGVLGRVGTAIATAFAVDKVIDFGKTVVNTTATFSDSMLKVQALTGATTSEFDAMKNMAMEYGSTTAHSSSAVADAMGYMALAGWDCNQIMEGLSGTLSLASTGQLDLATASDIVTDTMAMFNMKAEECGRASDVFAKVQAKANTNVEQLGEGMKYAGATASAFGLDIEQTSAMLGIMASAGIKASSGGTALKNILARLSAPTKEVNDGFKALGVNMLDSNGKMKDLYTLLPEVKNAMSKLSEAEQVSIAKKIAGSEAMSGFLALVNSSTDALPELTKELYNAGGFAEETANTMEAGLGGAIRGLQSAWEGFVLKIGEKVEAPLTDVITKMSDILRNIVPTITEFWSKYGDLISTLAISVGTFLAVKTVILALIPVFTTIKTVMMALTMVKSVAGFFTLLKVAMSGLVTCNPIVLGVAGVVGVLAGAGYLVYKNWDSLKAYAVQVWNNIKETVSKAWEGIKSFVTPIVESISSAISTAWNFIKDTTSSVWNGIKDFFVGLWEGIKSTFTTVLDAIGSHIQFCFNFWSNVISTVMGAIKNVIETVWNGIYKFIEPLLESIKVVVLAVWQGIQLALAVIVTAIATVIKTAWEGIKITVETIVNVIKTVIETAWNIIKTITMTIFDAIKVYFTNVFNFYKSIITTVIDFIKPYIESAWNRIKEVTMTVFNAIKNFLTSIWEGIKSVVSTVVNAISSTVSNVWNNIRNTTSNIFNSVKSTVTSIWNGIKSSVSSVVNGISSAVSSGFNKVKSTAISIFNALKSNVNSIWRGIGKGIQSCVNGIISVINGMVRAMNKISFDVPSWVPVMGGKKFGFNLPTVSPVSWFATGGIIKGTQEGTIVGVGENGGDEAIVPLSNKSRMKPFAEAVANMMPDNKGNGSGSDSEAGGVNIQVESLVVREEADVQKIAEELYRLQERNRRRRGVVIA